MIPLEDEILIWLTLNNNLPLKKLNQLINTYSLSEIWSNFSTNASIKSFVGAENFNKMLFTKENNYVKTYIKTAEEQGIKIVTIVNSNYPKLLKDTDAPPILLYCKGDIGLLNSPCLAVVGTRRCSRYGSDITKQFVNTLAKAGLTIVSGLADGVDSVALEETLAVGGKAIAVLGGGLNRIYPQSNVNLAERIAQNGLLISEYKPSERPQQYYFPQRNRIVAGLSKGVLITEATEKSGTMHTKNYCIEYGRELFAVPGRITDIYSSGTNKIIKNLQSAMVTDANDILNVLGLSQIFTKKQVIQVDLNDEIVLSIIGVNEIHYEELLKKSSFGAKELNTILTRLELKGLIKKLPGNFYSK